MFLRYLKDKIDTYLIACAMLCSVAYFVSASAALTLENQTNVMEFSQATSDETKDEKSGKEIEPEASPENDTKEATEDQVVLKPEQEVESAPEILFDLEKLPFPTRKMRQLIYDAAKSGDIEKLRPYIGYGDDVTMLSLGGYDADPIDFLKSISGDPLGQELLAIISEILEAGFVLMDEGTERETYVWPYFYAHSLEDLTPEQKVQLYRIITFGDYQDMEAFGSYIFYRLGITPEGRWRFFVAGD